MTEAASAVRESIQWVKTHFLFSFSLELASPVVVVVVVVVPAKAQSRAEGGSVPFFWSLS